MQKVNSVNERIKRQYFRRLREADGYSESTIDNIAKAIETYEDSSGFADFQSFDSKKAVTFKKYLGEKVFRGNQISNRTKYHYLRNVKRFFTWLSGQPGFKSKISLDDVSYLTLDRKSVREALEPTDQEYPSLELVRKLAGSIRPDTEIDKRDRALISFTLLSGMRDKAIVTLPLRSFDPESLRVNQSPRLKVETKFSKSNHSVLFSFDQHLLQFFLDWYWYLVRTKLFSDTSPLFPRTKLTQTKDNLAFTGVEVEPKFWKSAGSMRNIFKKRSETGELKYYPPHRFRHTAVNLAMKSCRTAEELKAVSQNFGHELVGTTMMTYGKLDNDRVVQVIQTLDIAGTNSKLSREEKERLAKLILES